MAYFEKLKKNFQSFCLFLIIDLSVGSLNSDFSRLRADLLRGYDPHSRPTRNHQFRKWLPFTFKLKGFHLDERTSVLNVYSWTVMCWTDQRMQWDPANYGNLTSVTFATHELWMPTFVIFNSVDKSEVDPFQRTRSSVLTVYDNSWVYWYPPTKFQVRCRTNLRKWPYDIQKCIVAVGSWTNDGFMLDASLEDIRMDTSLFESNREWDLLSATFKKEDRIYSGHHFPGIVLTIEISRKSNAHTASIVVPGLVIAAAVLVAFWLPPGCSQRLSILLVSIFINVLYLCNIYTMIPNNGESVPLVLLFYRDSLIMLASALIWTISLRYLATKRNSPAPLPGVIVTFLNSVPAKILCLDPRPSTGGKAETGVVSGGDATVQNEGSGNGNPLGSEVEKNVNPFQPDWAWLAHLLDRVAFLIYLIVYLCFYLALL